MSAGICTCDARAHTLAHASAPTALGSESQSFNYGGTICMLRISFLCVLIPPIAAPDGRDQRSAAITVKLVSGW